MSLLDDVAALHDVAVTWRDDAGVVAVHGHDATTFLQNLVSADLDGLQPGQGAASLLLAPQGKVDVAFVALRTDVGWLLLTDPGWSGRLRAALLRYRIRVAVEVDDLSDAWALAAVRGVRTDDVVSAALGVEMVEATGSHAPWRAARVVRPWWPGGRAVDVVGPRAEVELAVHALAGAGVPVCDADAYEVVRIEIGRPRMGAELDERTIPQEAFLARDAVSFTKGCFVGQELVCRIDTRGHVNRHLRRVVDIDGGPPPPGAEIVAGDTVVGALTSVTPAGVPPVALGYVRREVEPPADVVLRWDDATATARVLDVPRSP